MKYKKDSYYHLYNRGCNKEIIFRNKNDYKKLIDIISNSRHVDYLEICALSLMPNHYHFLVKQISNKPVTAWIRYIFNKYVKYYNHKYERKGRLFENSVRSIEIEKEDYLTTLTHYINNNPKEDLFLQEYCSRNFFQKNSFLHLEFYFNFFYSLKEYENQFNEYRLTNNYDLITKYIFEDDLVY